MKKEVYQKTQQVRDKHWWFLGRRRVIESVLTNSLDRRNLKILDVGCGSATSISVLKNFGQLFGVDKSSEAIRFCSQQGYFQLKRESAVNLSFQDQKFDLIAALDLIEHVENDQKALSEFARVCKVGGHLIVTVPAFPFLWGENDIAIDHLRRYKRTQLREKIERAGFKIKKLSYFNFFLFPLFLVWYFTRKVKLKISGNWKPQSNVSINLLPIVNRFLYLIFSSEVRFLSKVNFPFGLSLVCLAQKR